MKNFTIFFSTLLIPSCLLWAALTPQMDIYEKSHNQDIPTHFLTSPNTLQVEWGCPVDDVVMATSKAEALGKIEYECREQVRRAANEKPEVMDVIATKLIWPDVLITETHGGYKLTGTFFLETTALLRGQVKK